MSKYGTFIQNPATETLVSNTADSNFHTRLVNELTELDKRESKGKHYNRYALAQYFRAAENVIENINEGQLPEVAFAKSFTPTRGMHTVAKRLGLNLDVERGRWIKKVSNNGAAVSVANPIADMVKTIDHRPFKYRVYHTDTKRGKPYFMETTWPSNHAVEDIGYFATIEAAEKAALKHWQKHYHNAYKENPLFDKDQLQDWKRQHTKDKGKIERQAILDQIAQLKDEIWRIKQDGLYYGRGVTALWKPKEKRLKELEARVASWPNSAVSVVNPKKKRLDAGDDAHLTAWIKNHYNRGDWRTVKSNILKFLAYSPNYDYGNNGWNTTVRAAEYVFDNPITAKQMVKWKNSPTQIKNPIHYSIYEKATNKTYLQVKRGGREAAEKIASDLNEKAGFEKYSVMGFGNENPSEKVNVAAYFGYFTKDKVYWHKSSKNKLTFIFVTDDGQYCFRDGKGKLKYLSYPMRDFYTEK